MGMNSWGKDYLAAGALAIAMKTKGAGEILPSISLAPFSRLFR
jgi:hypothetical protein